MGLLSRKVTCNAHGQDSSYFLGWEEYEKNPYDDIKNPDGIIQMGLAENQLSFDLIEAWLAKNPEAANFEREGQSIFRELALFQDYHGLPSFKKAMADFMSENRGNRVSFDPKKLVLTAGATSANETLMFCLADPGDAFLLPTPYYPGFDRDLKWRTGAEIVPIQCTSANGFRITKSALEEAYEQAQKLNLKVKGVLITNPSNPLGTTTTRTELNHLLDFVSRKNIHLISDEIYSGTVFTSPGFISVMEVLKEKKLENTDVSKRVHIVYSLSKDLGLPGFRVGVIYSNDDIVVDAATKMSSFGLISSQTQYLLSALLSDKNFTKNYLRENQIRLKKRHMKLVSGLEAAGIECLKSNAGLFCWVDMRHLLSSNTFEAEIELWKKIVYEVKLNISPGSSCHCNEPANETLMFCLADPGDAFLLPTPYYPGFDRDLKWRTGAEIVPIQCTSANGFRITKSALEEAYEQAQKLNLKVKGVLITNPSNPLGTTTTRTELNHLLDFVSRKNIHLISDEIYSGTVFTSPGFISVMEVLKEKKLENTDVSKRVHIVYSLSKDLGLPGFRVGVIYSNDDIVVDAATKMSSFGLISSQTQYLLSALLSDKNFTKNYLRENQIRLKKRHMKLVSGLEAAGIECLKSNAGLFCWVDMRHLLSSNTFEAEIELWKKIVYEVKLNISPGSSCHCNEPGWFRVCFANMSEETLKVAMNRLKMFVDGPSSSTRSQSEHQRLKRLRKMKVSNWVFRLSFQDREPEER